MAKYPYIPLNDNVEEMFIGPFGSSLKNDAFVEEDEAYCMVYEQKHAIKKTMDVDTRYVNRKKYEELKRFNIKGGDIIVSCRGTIGETYIVPEGAPLGIMHPSIMKIRLKPGVYNKQYFNLLLRNYLKRHEDEANGSGIKMAISAKELGTELFPVPNMSEQNQIALTFAQVDELIALRKEQLAKLDQLVKSRFIELFGHPVENEMCWKKVPLSACVGSIDNGKSFVCDTEARQGEWPAVLKLSAATYGFYRPEENKALLEENQFIENAAVHAGDLLFTRKNTPELVGMCAYVYDTPNGLMMPDLIFRLNTTENCNKVFLWKLINHDFFRNCVQAIATGSAKSMSNISKERLLKLEVILPPLELQEQFAAFVEQTDKSKLAIQQSLDKLELLKNSLMQEYFG